MKAKDLVLCAVMAALTCVLAPLSVTIATAVPISLATFAVMLSGVLLGGGYGALSQVIYLILGAVGLPVCAGWTPALPRIIGPTGGYLIGYIPLAFICGAVYRAWSHGGAIKKYAALIGGMILGTAALYAFGTAWFCMLNSVRVTDALAVCVVPFLIGDAAKIAVVTVLAPRLESAVQRLPLGGKLSGSA